MRLGFRPLLLGAAIALFCSTAFAGPDPAKLKAASESFEAGAKAAKEKKHEEAAAHFEAADSAVPSPKALRLAIRARADANQGSRAATLAALALDRYPDDPKTKELAEEILGKYAKQLHKLEVSCASPCLLAVGAKIVHGEAATRRVLYVDPGQTSIGASFLGKITAADQNLAATAGGSGSIRFTPPKDGPPVGTGGGGTGGGEPSGGSPPVGGGGSDVGGSGGEGGSIEPVPGETPPDDDWRITPVPFFIGLAATAGLGGATIWSGIDTMNEPGVDRVREECRGLGEECALYQEGEEKELRTNILIGTTAGVGALTVIFAIVADWDGDPEPEDMEVKADSAVIFEVPRLWLGVGDAKASGVEVRGRF